jgi:hypothetical protein
VSKTIIEGLFIEISTDELHAHLVERASFHTEKMSNDPATSLRISAQNHRNRAGFFTFLADHLIADATYRLEESDLVRLELASRHL